MAADPPPPEPPLTRMLQRAAAGERSAMEELLPLVYEQLKQLATQRLGRWAPANSMDATALVHEAWLRLGGHELPDFGSRAQFFAAAARSMRNILVDAARFEQRERRGGGRHRQTLLDDALSTGDPAPIDILALDEALHRLEQQYDRTFQVVMLRFFAGLEYEQIGSSLGISKRTAEREWRFARSWLQVALESGAPPAGHAPGD